MQRATKKRIPEHGEPTDPKAYGENHLLICLPNYDDDKVEQVPAVADVGAGVHHQTVGQDL